MIKNRKMKDKISSKMTIDKWRNIRYSKNNGMDFKKIDFDILEFIPEVNRTNRYMK